MGISLQTFKSLRDDRDTYLRLLGYLTPYRMWFAVMFLTSIPLAAVDGALALITGPMVDHFLKDRNFGILKLVPVILLVVTLIQGVLSYLNAYFSTQLSNAISRDIRKDLFNQMTRFELAYFRNNPSGDIYSRFYVDTMKLQQAIVTNMHDFILEFFTMIFLAAVLLYQNWKFALISIGIISLIVVPLQVISKKLRRLDYQLRDLNTNIIIIFMEYLSGVKEVKVFRLLAYMRKRFNKSLEELFSVSISSNKAGALLKPSMQMIGAVGIGLILYLGVSQVEQGLMTLGEFTSFMVAMALMMKPIKTIGGILGKVQVILAPAERVFSLMDRKPEVVSPDNPNSVGPFESLVFEDVEFSYNDNEQVLKGLNFEVKAGKTVALAGPSGGGKSTLVDLIPRFMDPTAGRILFNGVDLRDVEIANVHEQIAIVSQDNVLFNMTIRENIRLGRLEATEEEIRAAAKSAHILHWIETLPEGLDTLVGERGTLLSGGQRQRVAIARAFLKNAPLLILDEATSALDNESEKLVQDALKELMKGKTVIVIAHRLSTIQHADRILMLEKGKIVESGTHEELLKHEGIYNKFYRMQFIENKSNDALATA